MAVPLTLSSVPAQTPYVQYIATASQTLFPYPFEITQDSDLVVLLNGAAQPTDGGYTLSGQGATNGGNVTFTVGLAAGTIVTFYRNITIARITQLSQNGTFFSANFNSEYNRIYLILQQLQQAISNSLQIPNTNNPIPNTVLTAANYANTFLAFDSHGNPEPGLVTNTTISQSVLGGLLFPQTASEVAGGVIPTSYQYTEGNILRYGADPTGTVSSFVAIQSAMKVACAAAISSGLGNHVAVYIPHGKYIIDSTNVFGNPLGATGNVIRGIRVYGDGMGSSELYLQTGSTTSLWLFNPSNTTEQSYINFTMSDIYVTSDNGLYANGFNWAQSQGFDFTRVYFNTINTIFQNSSTANNGDSLKCFHCRATNVYGAVFTMDNNQSLNNEFHSCDWEQVMGTVYNVTVQGGGAVRTYGGSHIMNNLNYPTIAPNQFTGSVSGTTLTVTAVSSGSYVPVWSWLQGGTFPAEATNPGRAQIIAQLTGSLGGPGTYKLNQSLTITSTLITSITYLLSIAIGASLGDNNNNYTFHGIQTQLETPGNGLVYAGSTGNAAPQIVFNNINNTENNGARATVVVNNARVTFNSCILTENQNSTYLAYGPTAGGAQYGDPGSIIFNSCEVPLNPATGTHLSTLCSTPVGFDGLAWGYISARDCYASSYQSTIGRNMRYAMDFDLNWQNRGRAGDILKVKRVSGRIANYAWPAASGSYASWTVALPDGAQVVRVTVYRAATATNASYALYSGDGTGGAAGSANSFGSVTGSNCNAAQTISWDEYDTPANWYATGSAVTGSWPAQSNQIQIWTTSTVNDASVGGTGYFVVEYI